MCDEKLTIYFCNSGPDVGKIYKEVPNTANEIKPQGFVHEEITAEDARREWRSMNIKDCNVAFNRLANYDFNVDAALASYDN